MIDESLKWLRKGGYLICIIDLMCWLGFWYGASCVYVWHWVCMVRWHAPPLGTHCITSMHITVLLDSAMYDKSRQLWLLLGLALPVIKQPSKQHSRARTCHAFDSIWNCRTKLQALLFFLLHKRQPVAHAVLCTYQQWHFYMPYEWVVVASLATGCTVYTPAAMMINRQAIDCFEIEDLGAEMSLRLRKSSVALS